MEQRKVKWREGYAVPKPYSGLFNGEKSLDRSASVPGHPEDLFRLGDLRGAGKHIDLRFAPEPPPNRSRIIRGLRSFLGSVCFSKATHMEDL
jgi:hypothetical protein